VAGISRPNIDAALTTAHQLHREEPLSVFSRKLVQLYEICMTDVGESAELALEPEQRLGRDVLEPFQRNRRPFAQIANLIDDPEPAGAEPALDNEAICAAKRRRDLGVGQATAGIA
jgi:hypothetical protein